jgi:hypothetical protein
MGMNVSQESDAMLSLMRLVNQLIDG